MNSIKLRIAAKTDVGLVRDNNEDNFQASSDLSIEPMRWVNNEICSLGEKGALLPRDHANDGKIVLSFPAGIPGSRPAGG